MRVLMIVRRNLFSSPGGDTTQITMTAKYLRLLNVVVDIKLSDSVLEFSDVDLIHFFNIIRPDDILPHLPKFVPYVVSTIFVDYSEYDQNVRVGIRKIFFKILSKGQAEYLKAIARWIFNGDRIRSMYYLFYGHKQSIKKIANGAKMLLPNSFSEYNRFNSYLNISKPFDKVVNAIDLSVFNDQIIANKNYSNHVICVGRIEGLKNQLKLIEALGGKELQLTIIGKPAANHAKYYEECLSLGKTFANVHFLEHLTSTELAGIYKAAKVHVLPSWFETTGLSSLEAGIMGCNVVVTSKGDTVEYFGDMAYYCSPDNTESIYNSVLEAFNAPRNAILSSYIRNNYHWGKAAEQTLAAYQKTLKN